MSQITSSNEDNDLNIFKELSWDLDFWKIEEKEEVQKKDKLYYTRLWSIISNYIMIFIVFSAIIFWAYVYVQKNENMLNSDMLVPICGLILWDINPDQSTCSSVYSLNNNYVQKVSDLEKDTLSKLSSIFMWVYELNSFKDSKEVVFLQSTYPQSKTKTLEILKDFDSLKGKFLWWGNPKQIICSGINIDNLNNFEINCDFYTSEVSEIVSSDLNSKIKWSAWAFWASFINYIQKRPENNFILIEKPKDFKVEDIDPAENPPYIKKTTLKLKLKYSNIETNL